MRSDSSSLPNELQLTVQTFHTQITLIFATCILVYNLNMFELIRIENMSRSISHGTASCHASQHENCEAQVHGIDLPANGSTHAGPQGPRCRCEIKEVQEFAQAAAANVARAFWHGRDAPVLECTCLLSTTGAERGCPGVAALEDWHHCPLHHETYIPSHGLAKAT
jgi:hypothetical protein